MKRPAYVLACLATALAGGASVAGLLTSAYRDAPAMVDQARGTDLATLFVAVPLLATALRRIRLGSATTRVAVAAGLGYLVYTYAIYAFQVVVNPLTPAHIGILGLACWSLALQAHDLRTDEDQVGEGLPRRTSIGFLSLTVIVFGGMWLSQIGQAIVTGDLPKSVAELQVPTSAVYALDLAFVLPVFVVAAVMLALRSPGACAVTFGCLVFSVLMALSIMGLFIVQAAHGSLDDPSLPIGFAVIAAAGAAIAAVGVRQPGTSHRPDRPTITTPI
jgi:hypothetical protein